MQRSARKNPRLREKLESIQREIDRMEKDIKGISRAVDTPDPEQALRRLKQVPGAAIVGREVTAGVRTMQPESIRQFPTEEVVSPSPAALSVPRGGASLAGEDAATLIPKIAPDDRFATYFGSGSLHSVRPLRQERRVQRNKAIFMLVMAALLITFVLKMIF